MKLGRHAVDELEFYGDESQIRLQQRCYRLWPFLKAHPRLSFVGRAIGIDDPALDEVENLIGLTMELGFLANGFIPATTVDEFCSAFEEHGLKTGIWPLLVSNEETESSCRSVVASLNLPPGYRTERISATTLPQQLRRFQELMQSCGVAPLPGFLLRGQAVPTIADMIVAPHDEIVATGAAVFRHNPAGRYRKAAHVGFLATEPSQRGRGFGRLLLARIILACHEEHKAEPVYTGVRADNVPSQRVCQSCGLVDRGLHFVGASYPQTMGYAEFTR
jgi:RimJ/RimL family protein N-acetyltransferase